MDERELCRIVKQSDLFPSYRLHEEVGISGVSCDMIYENGTDVYCIEAKLQFNFAVLRQAIRWQRVATASFIAIPMNTYKDDNKRAVLEALGLGVILVNGERASFAPGFNPFVNTHWDHCRFYRFPADMEYWGPCFERIEDKGEAGSRNCERSTTFSRTIAALKLEAAKHPGYNLKQLLNLVPPHYSSVYSAHNSLKRYAEQGIIEKFWEE